MPLPQIVLALLLSVVSIRPLCAQASPSVQVVARLYRDYSWELDADLATLQERRTLINEPSEVLGRYFDVTLVRLILKDRACVEESQGICNLDFSPIWASQDPGAEDLRITGTADASVVEVSFRYPSSDHVVRLSYRLASTSAGWRVRDIVYPSGRSLLRLLEQ